MEKQWKICGQSKKLMSLMIAVVFLMGTISFGTKDVGAAKLVKLNASSKTIAVGQKYKLKLKNNKKKVTWKSSKKSVASVSSKGVVTGKKKGKATITAKVKKTGRTYKCKIKVEKITLNKSDVYFLYNSGKDSPSVSVKGTKREVTWSVEDDSVFKIFDPDKKEYVSTWKNGKKYSNCLVHPEHPGETVLTATVGGYKMQCKLHEATEGTAAGEYVKTGLNPYELSDSVLAAADKIKDTLEPKDASKTSIVKDKKTLEEKIVAVHDAIIANTKYDIDNLNANKVPQYDHSIVGPMLHGLSVCDGYAYTFQAYMTALDIPCDFVIGTVASPGALNGNHAWNQVKLSDNQWYHVDCTFDDPVSDNQQEYLEYNYLFVDDATMKDYTLMGTKHAWNVTDYSLCKGSTYLTYKDDLVKAKLISICGEGNVVDARTEAIQVFAKQLDEKKGLFSFAYLGDSPLNASELDVVKNTTTAKGYQVKMNSEKKGKYYQYVVQATY